VGSVWYGPELGADEHHWWVWDIAVDREHRGRGIGTEVLALVAAHVRGAGGTALGLSVAGHNQGARRLYERVGYQVAAVRMQKVL
jgi:ribosomal protein S18 acetylase RimI-like enzyme